MILRCGPASEHAPGVHRNRLPICLHLWYSRPLALLTFRRTVKGDPSTSPRKESCIPMTTEKQIDANRRNAQLSTGPTTREGKAASSLNAFKHGMHATGFVIPAGQSMESLDEYEGLLAALRHDLLPRGAMQELLVESIAIQYWRLRRVYRAELRGVVGSRSDDDLQRAMLQLVVREEKPPKALPVFLPSEHIADKLMRYQRVLESSITRQLAELRRLQQTQTPPQPEERPSLPPAGSVE